MIPRIEQREFAFTFGDDMQRPLTFSSEDALYSFIRKARPSHCYVSTAYYERPYAKKMQDKGWLGADILIDVDADSIPIARVEAERIYAACLDPLGFKKVAMNFSGCKGYHIIIFDEDVHTLDREARRMLIDYFIDHPQIRVEHIDIPASTDLHRLRRIENTLNSKCGKRCVRLKQTERYI
ncbi:MAG: DNA primase small subunit domain-containing protein [Methermicoccaceae archaeon]